MSTLGWFVCLCACLVVGCAKTVRRESNQCIDEYGNEYQVGDYYETKCEQCDCTDYGAECHELLCGIPYCEGEETVVYNDPDACCPYCAPVTGNGR